MEENNSKLSNDSKSLSDQEQQFVPLKEGSIEKDRLNSFEDFIIMVGGRGPYSCMVLGIMFICFCYCGSLTLGHNFTAAQQKYTCNINSSLQHSQASGDCSIHAIDNECRISVNCTDGFRQEDCSSWTFSTDEFSNTIVSKFALVCGRSYLAELPSTSYFAGALFGSTIFGMLSDYFGRRVALLFALSNTVATNIVAALAPTYWLYTAAMLFIGAGLGGLVTVGFTILTESTVSSNILYWSLNGANGWSVGSMLVALIAYITRDYQYQLIFLGGGALLYIPLAAFAGESPRWLVSTGRLKRAHSAVMRVVRINRAAHKLPPDFNVAELAPKKIISSSVISFSSRNSSFDSAKSYGLTDLFRTPGLRKLTLLSWIHWFVVSMTFYGISLAAGSIGGNIFTNAVLVAAVELPSRYLGMLFTWFGVGRKPVLCMSFITSAVFLGIMVATFQFQDLDALRITLAVISKMGITLAFAFVWIYYNEVYPTVIRSVGTGSGSSVARIGAMVSTLLLPLREIWQPLPFIIFSIGPFLACGVIYFLPETMGKVLPETIEDGEKFVSSIKKHDKKSPSVANEEMENRA